MTITRGEVSVPSQGMTMSSDKLGLAAEFPTATRQQWRELVRGVLVSRRHGAAGSDADDTDSSVAEPEGPISTTTYDGLTVAPLYTAEDAIGPTTPPGLPPFVRGGRPEGGVIDGWDVRARYAETDPAVANEAILADLDNGVRSLWLVLGPDGLPVEGLDRALSDVLLDVVAVTLDAGAEFAAAAAELLRVHAGRGFLPIEATGNLGIDPIGWQARTGSAPEGTASVDAAVGIAARVSAEYHNLRAIVVDGLPYHDAGGSDAEELGASIATGVAYLRAFTDAGLSVDEAARQLEFRYAINADQFLGIAKLRAARRLWARVTEVSGVSVGLRAQRQHAVTSSAMMTQRDPWVNMLRTTVACFASGIGGADAVTVMPFDTAVGLPTEHSRRIARNTQSILLDESQLAGVIDPAGGSWYVESLTDALAKRAWQIFTEIERDGGIVAGLESGAIAERLARTWAERRANIGTRRDAITGVNEFPHLAEQPLERRPARAATIGSGAGLPRVRYAQDFEALRDRSDAATARTGQRPAVFLATLGPIAAHTARASFAANLFFSGGIDAPNAGATDNVDQVVAAFRDSGLRVVCLCGTDAAYAEQAAPLIALLKQAGAARVLLAGPRSDEHAAAGVDEFVYRGCPVLDVVTGIFDLLEVA